MPLEPLDHETAVHRLGGGSSDNLRLKPKETTLLPPGISVFAGGNVAQVREQIRRAFPNATRLLEVTRTVGTATLAAIRRAGFDVIADPTRHFPNHARLIHPDAARGFGETRLDELSRAFTNETRS